MKKKILLILFVTFSLPMAFALVSAPYPQRPLPTELTDVFLTLSDFPPASIFQMTNLSRDPVNGGWDTKKSFNPEDIVQGRLDVWKMNDIGLATKYGYFESPNAANNAARSSIYYASYPMVYNRRSGSFSGSTFGDSSYYWDISFERVIVTPPAQTAALSFSSGRFAFLVYGFSKGPQIDKGLLEAIARKAEKKIELAIALAGFSSALPGEITNVGILHSLQVKLDNFTKNYRQGDYKVAMNNIKSFVNELDAQRGKHVPEPTYQILKAFADTIITSLGFLT